MTRDSEMTEAKFVSREDIEDLKRDEIARDFWEAIDLAERLLAERDAYRYVAIQNSYQGVDISDKTVCGLVDAEALRLLSEGKKGEERCEP